MKIAKNNSGFMTAEFLFAFTMVIGCGIFIFGLTFSLTTIEIAQYIVWSSARSYAVGNISSGDQNKHSETAGRTKYKNLTAAFPLLTGNGSDSPWFRMPDINDNDFLVGDLSLSIKEKDGGIDSENKIEGTNEARHPWLGVESSIDLILFKGLQIPFLGKIAANPEEFKFPVRGILLRHPSVDECQTFFKNKFAEGIQQLPAEAPSAGVKWEFTDQQIIQYVPIEDNGC